MGSREGFYSFEIVDCQVSVSRRKIAKNIIQAPTGVTQDVNKGMRFVIPLGDLSPFPVEHSCSNPLCNEVDEISVGALPPLVPLNSRSKESVHLRSNQGSRHTLCLQSLARSQYACIKSISAFLWYSFIISIRILQDVVEVGYVLCRVRRRAACDGKEGKLCNADFLLDVKVWS